MRFKSKRKGGCTSLPQSTYEAGTCNTICARTGFKVKLSETVEEWTGNRVLADHAESRHPQDFQITPKPNKTYKNATAEDEENIKVYTPVEDVTKL